MELRHLRLANAVGSVLPCSARKDPRAEFCFVDYASCKQSDVCWLVDLDAGCDQSDNCIVDTS